MTKRDLQSLFLRQSTVRLQHDYLPKLERCLAALDEEQVWWRPHADSCSVGNLSLHVCGNLRQWIVHGLGGRPDIRVRQEEFDRTGGVSRAELAALLQSVVSEACDVIGDLDEACLRRRHEIQGYWVDGVAAVYHVVEHFSGHTGQVIWITKMLTGKGLGFYRL